MEAGSDWGSAFALSPKVFIPFFAGLIGFGVTWAATGEFNGEALAVLLATLGYGILGVAAPPAANVTQSEVAAISRKRS
jgi:hypothetical protein